MNQIQNEFLGSMSAIVVESHEQLQKLKEFMGMKNLFLSDGTPVTQLNMNVLDPIAFYRDTLGRFVGYDSPNVVGMNYTLHNFNEAFNEQATLFGDNSTGIVQQPDETLVSDAPIDVEVKEVKNEVALNDMLNKIEIGTLTPAKCDGPLLDCKDEIISFISQYENIIVTKDNYSNLKENTVSKFNKKIDDLKKSRASFNNEVKKFTEPYSKAFSEIINAIENINNSLKNQIKVFEDEEKEERIKEFFKTHIMPELMTCFENGSISQKQVQEFKFNDKWLNKDALTDIGNLRKKTSDAIKAEIKRLIDEYTQEKNDIATIESTVKQLAIARGVNGSLNADTYVELYKKGTLMPEIQERINQDIAIIKKTVDSAVQKQTQNIQSQQQTSQDKHQVENIQNIADTKNVTILSDEKTGEVVAKGDEQKMMVLVGGSKTNTNIYQYVYNFSGDIRAMTTFNRFIKLLAKMFNFKAERILQVKNDEHIKLINDFKERVGK